MSFWKELKRRNVYKVGIAYLIVAWLIVQAAAIVFPHLNLPTWAVTLVIVLLIIGFPLILLFSWAFEITPDGLKLTKDVPHHESITHLTGKKLNYILAGLLVIAVGYILVDKLYIVKRTTQPEQVSVSGEAVAKKTIAVLPFVNLSSDPEQEYFVDGLSEELLNTLAQIPDLGVTARTSSFTFKNSDKTVQEIASVLGVENILEGSVRKAGDALRITAQLVHTADGLHLWSKTYDRELKDIFAVQEDIATAVTSELKAALGISKSLKFLGGTDNAEAYEQYLIAKGQMGDIIFDAKSVQEGIDSAIDLDPKFALAWALKASIHQMKARGMGAGPPNVDEPSSFPNVAEELDAGLKAAQKAIELEPDLAEAYAVLGGQRAVRGEWFEAESAYRKALELGNESTLMIGNYTPYLFALGYFKKANTFLEVVRKNDPLRQNIYSMSRNSYICLRDRQHAEEEQKRRDELFGDMFEPRGDYDIRLNFSQVSLDEILNVSMVTDEFRQRIKSPEDLLSEMRKSGMVEPQTAAYFGDPELALYAIEQSVTQHALNINQTWFPVMKEVRQLPRFKEFLREIGLVDYWEEFGWPDICRPVGDGDFECD